MLIPVNKNYIQDCGTESFDFHSGHRLLKCKVKIEDFRKKIYENVNQKTINGENSKIYEKEFTVSLQKSETLEEIIKNVEKDTKYCNSKETKPSCKPSLLPGNKRANQEK